MRKCADELRPCRKCGTLFVGRACKVCAAAKVARYRERHPDRVKVSRRKTRVKHAEKVAEYQREYSKENRSRLSETARERRRADPERYREYSRARRVRDLEHARELDRKRTARPERREYRKRYTRAYREANAERLQAEKRAWYEANRERLRQKSKETSREWARRNPDRVRASALRRIARKKNAPGTHHTAADVRSQFKAQRGLCYWCKIKLEKYEVDHVVPLARGGSNGKENIVCACRPCNRRKGAKMPAEFAGVLL